MPRTNFNDLQLTPSVLDRLIDDRPGISQQLASSRAAGLRELKAAVRRDLEWLLNTRQTEGGIPPELRELSNSVAAYGVPDFTALSIRNPADQQRMQREMESAIRTFEPRLENVSVVLEPPDSDPTQLRFRIEARLRVEPSPEPVTFDTTLQTHSGEFTIRGD
ncbi:MAG TPA: type VI secretion system baseplate subunit TssE [Blastocatellia bacterium]|nr:type VI secretion system baseplate subunit TssE [Blastocatellia bacterium]